MSLQPIFPDEKKYTGGTYFSPEDKAQVHYVDLDFNIVSDNEIPTKETTEWSTIVVNPEYRAVAFASGLVDLKCRHIDLNKGDIVIFSKFTREIYKEKELVGSGITFFDGIKLVTDVKYYKEKLDIDVNYGVNYVIPKYLDIFHGFPINYWNRVIPEYYMDLLYRLKEPRFAKQLRDNLVFDTFFTEDDTPLYRTSFVVPKKQNVLKKISDQMVPHIIKDLSNIVLDYELYDEYHIIIESIGGEPSGSEKELRGVQDEFSKNIDDPDSFSFDRHSFSNFLDVVYKESPFRISKGMKDWVFYMYVDFGAFM